MKRSIAANKFVTMSALAVIALISVTLGQSANESSLAFKDSDSVKQTREKLKTIKLSVEFANVTLEKAIELLRNESIGKDATVTRPDLKGVNLVIMDQNVGLRKIAALKLDQMFLGEILVQIAMQTRTKFFLADYGVVFDDEKSKLGTSVPSASREAKKGTTELELSEIVIPLVHLDGMTLLEVRDFLVAQYRHRREANNQESTVDFDTPSSAISEVVVHSLRLRNVTLLAVIQAIADLAGVRYVIAENTVRFSAVETTNSEKGKCKSD